MISLNNKISPSSVPRESRQVLLVIIWLFDGSFVDKNFRTGCWLAMLGDYPPRCCLNWIYSWVCLLLKCLTSHENIIWPPEKSIQNQWCHGTGDHLSLDDAFSVHLGLGLGVLVQPPEKGRCDQQNGGKTGSRGWRCFSIVSWGWNWDHQFLQLNHLEGIETLKIWRKKKYTKSAERNGKPTSWSDPQKSYSSWAPTVFKPG